MGTKRLKLFKSTGGFPSDFLEVGLGGFGDYWVGGGWFEQV